MKTQFLTGSKQQIAESVAHMSGEVLEAIVFLDDPADRPENLSDTDVFDEMEPFTVKAGGADYSRDTLYTRLEDE